MPSRAHGPSSSSPLRSTTGANRRARAEYDTCRNITSVLFGLRLQTLRGPGGEGCFEHRRTGDHELVEEELVGDAAPRPAGARTRTRAEVLGQRAQHHVEGAIDAGSPQLGGHVGERFVE